MANDEEMVTIAVLKGNDVILQSRFPEDGLEIIPGGVIVRNRLLSLIECDTAKASSIALGECTKIIMIIRGGKDINKTGRYCCSKPDEPELRFDKVEE